VNRYLAHDEVAVHDDQGPGFWGRAMARLRAMARGPRRGIAAARPSGLVPHWLRKIGPGAHTPSGARYLSEKK
jgi:hypothetical protein